MGTNDGRSVSRRNRPSVWRWLCLMLLLGATAGGERLGVSDMRLVEINGQPGGLFVDRDDRPVLAVALDIADDLITTIRAVSNPEKLHHLGRSKRA